MAKHIYSITGLDNLCLAGGVALNCVGNGKILQQSPFKNIWIQPAAGNAGGALGAALLVWHKYLNQPRISDKINDRQKGSYLGPKYSNEDIKNCLKPHEAHYEKYDKETLAAKIAQLIEQQNVVGLFQGRMEFGPRALGGRSILGDARSEKMQEILNLKIKFRESFRPFAPSVLKEKVSEYFDLNGQSPYMLLVAKVKKEQILEQTKDVKKEGLDKLKGKRSTIPAITHVDYSARIQTVSQETNPFYYKIIEEFEQLTGCPVIINTSFNVRGEPIVGTPEDAYRCFMCTNMDYLVIEDYLFEKTKQPHRDQYKLEDISLQLD